MSFLLQRKSRNQNVNQFSYIKKLCRNHVGIQIHRLEFNVLYTVPDWNELMN